MSSALHRVIPATGRTTSRPAGRRRTRARKRSRGQSLVEFALVFPLFFTVMLALIEFAFAFNSVLAINYASRTAALVAAEGGSETGTDCLVLRSIEANVTAPSDPTQISEVDIYQATDNGDMIGTATTYLRQGSTTCSYGGGTTVTVPYSLTTDGYPEADRCNILAGCSDTHPALEIVGVKISYHHSWITPLRNFIGGNPGGFSFDRSNATRMEPVL